VGAVDMVNFGARDTVPAQFSDRRLYVHNAQVTLMRTTPGENAAIGRWIIERVNRMEGPVRFLLPLQGVSAIDMAGKPFHDPEADQPSSPPSAPRGQLHPTGSSSKSTPTSTIRPSQRPPSTPSATSPKDTDMARAYASIILKAPIETVWSLVRDFNGLPSWPPPWRSRRSRTASIRTSWAACAPSTCMMARMCASAC
jgi:hypothetical protein